MNGPYSWNFQYANIDPHQEHFRFPEVAVIVSCYNYADYIGRCLDSILKQTYTNFKCVIVDDCSLDRSVEVVEGFIKSHNLEGRFQLIRHDENGGQMEAFKTGLKHTEGIFVVFVDADDQLFEDFLWTHVKAHLNFMPVAFTSSNQFQINEKNEIIAGMHPDLSHKGQNTVVRPLPLQMAYWVWATTSSMMFRRSTLDIIMPEDSRPFRICADNYICHFANLIGGSLLIPTVHGSYRRHSKNGFSINPILGGRLPTGDLRQHPSHVTLLECILAHLLKYHEQFISLLSLKRFMYALSYILTPYDILFDNDNIREIVSLGVNRYVLFFLTNLTFLQLSVLYFGRLFRKRNVSRKVPLDVETYDCAYL